MVCISFISATFRHVFIFDTVKLLSFKYPGFILETETAVPKGRATILYGLKACQWATAYLLELLLFCYLCKVICCKL